MLGTRDKPLTLIEAEAENAQVKMAPARGESVREAFRRGRATRIMDESVDGLFLFISQQGYTATRLSDTEIAVEGMHPLDDQAVNLRSALDGLGMESVHAKIGPNGSTIFVMGAAADEVFEPEFGGMIYAWESLQEMAMPQVASGQLFTDDQLRQLRDSFAQIQGVDPTIMDGAYQRLATFLDQMDQDLLTQVSRAGIKFLSALAWNRVEGDEPFSGLPESKLREGAGNVIGKDSLWHQHNTYDSYTFPNGMTIRPGSVVTIDAWGSVEDYTVEEIRDGSGASSDGIQIEMGRATLPADLMGKDIVRVVSESKVTPEIQDLADFLDYSQHANDVAASVSGDDRAALSQGVVEPEDRSEFSRLYAAARASLQETSVREDQVDMTRAVFGIGDMDYFGDISDDVASDLRGERGAKTVDEIVFQYNLTDQHRERLSQLTSFDDESVRRVMLSVTDFDEAKLREERTGVLTLVQSGDHDTFVKVDKVVAEFGGEPFWHPEGFGESTFPESRGGLETAQAARAAAVQAFPELKPLLVALFQESAGADAHIRVVFTTRADYDAFAQETGILATELEDESARLGGDHVSAWFKRGNDPYDVFMDTVQAVQADCGRFNGTPMGHFLAEQTGSLSLDAIAHRMKQMDLGFFDEDKAQCDCGGSGYVPGIPDDIPCPFHADKKALTDWYEEHYGDEEEEISEGRILRTTRDLTFQQSIDDANIADPQEYAVGITVPSGTKVEALPGEGRTGAYLVKTVETPTPYYAWAAPDEVQWLSESSSTVAALMGSPFKSAYVDDFLAGFNAGKSAGPEESKADAQQKYRSVSNEYGSFWVDGYCAALDLSRGAYATEPAQIAKALGLVEQTISGLNLDPIGARMRNGASFADAFYTAVKSGQAAPEDVEQVVLGLRKRGYRIKKTPGSEYGYVLDPRYYESRSGESKIVESLDVEVLIGEINAKDKAGDLFWVAGQAKEWASVLKDHLDKLEPAARQAVEHYAGLGESKLRRL